jgi:hypothetical protein
MEGYHSAVAAFTRDALFPDSFRISKKSLYQHELRTKQVRDKGWHDFGMTFTPPRQVNSPLRGNAAFHHTEIHIFLAVNFYNAITSRRGSVISSMA